MANLELLAAHLEPGGTIALTEQPRAATLPRQRQFRPPSGWKGSLPKSVS
jgi:hypothetical protein